MQPRSSHQGLGVYSFWEREKSPLGGHISYPLKEMYFKQIFAEESLQLSLHLKLFFFFFQRFLFIFGTERERAWTGEGQRERETQNRKQAPGSEPSAQSLTWGSNSWTARSWPGWSRTLNRLRHPGAPGSSYLKDNEYFILFYFFKNVFVFERERQSASRGGAEGERHTQNQKKDPASELSAQGPTQGSNPRTMRLWPELKPDA